MPFSAPSIVFFQMSDGRPEPYTGDPHLFFSGWVPSVVPTQTAVDSDGVKPTIQASRLSPVSPSWLVPVLAADGRPPARSWPLEYAAIGCIAAVTLSATALSMRCSPELSLVAASNSTWPSAFTTFCTKCGAW